MQAAVQELEAMGFAPGLAAEALRRKQGNVQDAVQLLLDHPEGRLPPEETAPPPPPPPHPPATAAAAAAEPPVVFGAGTGGAPVAVAQPFGVAPTYTYAAAPAYVAAAQAGYGAPPQQQQSGYPAYPAYTPAAAAGYGGAASSPYGVGAPPASAAAPHPQGMPTFAVPVSGYRPPPPAGHQPAGPQSLGAGVGAGVGAGAVSYRPAVPNQVSYQPTQPAEWAAYARAPLGAAPGATTPGQQGQRGQQGHQGHQGQPPSYTPPTSGYSV